MQAYSVLSELFPSWNAISTDSDLCVECSRLQEEIEAGKHIAAEEKVISGIVLCLCIISLI